MAKNRSILVGSLVALIYLYQCVARAIRPLPCCRFTPTCSAYAKEAFSSLGFVFGVWCVVKRLMKCHPWHPGGFDPVPKCSSERKYG